MTDSFPTKLHTKILQADAEVQHKHIMNDNCNMHVCKQGKCLSDAIQSNRNSSSLTELRKIRIVQLSVKRGKMRRLGPYEEVFLSGLTYVNPQLLPQLNSCTE